MAVPVDDPMTQDFGMFTAIIELINTSVTQYPLWFGFSIFLLACLETLAFIGVLVPGILLLGTTAFIAGSSGFPMLYALMAAWLGGMLGFWASYLFGYHYHDAIKNLKFFQKHEYIIQKSETWFQKYGMISVFIGRFIGPLRAIMPVIGGISGMSWVHFLVVELASGIIWTLVLIVPFFTLGFSQTEHASIPPYGEIILMLYLVGLWGMFQTFISIMKRLKSLALYKRLGVAFTLATLEIAIIVPITIFIFDSRWLNFFSALGTALSKSII